MRSKFVLHGGGGQFITVNDLHFYRSMVSEIDRKAINVLSIPYALPSAEKNERTNTRLAEDIFNILSYSNPHKVFKVLPAEFNKNAVQKQVALADVIFCHGGDGDALYESMTKYDLAPLLAEDKVCAGFSAGANIWSEAYYSNDNQAINYGLGIAPIATFCHYSDHKWGKLTELAKLAMEWQIALIPLSDDGFVTL